MRLLKYFLPSLLLLAVASQAGVAQAMPKMGYIDANEILRESTEAQAAQAQFDREMAQFQSQVQSMGEELQTMLAAYQQQAGTMSEEARTARETEITQKQQEYETRAQTLETEAAQRRAALVEPVMERINTIIEAVRTEGAYTLIFDIAAGAILAADPALDLTPEVLRRLSAAEGQSGN